MQLKSRWTARRLLVSRSTSPTLMVMVSHLKRICFSSSRSRVVQSVAQCRRTRSGMMPGRGRTVSATAEASFEHQYALTIWP
jgi:hypothetical protein